MKFVFRFPPSLPQAIASLAVFVILLVLARLSGSARARQVRRTARQRRQRGLAGQPRVGACRTPSLIGGAVSEHRECPDGAVCHRGGVLFLFMVRT